MNRWSCHINRSSPVFWDTLYFVSALSGYFFHNFVVFVTFLFNLLIVIIKWIFISLNHVALFSYLLVIIRVVVSISETYHSNCNTNMWQLFHNMASKHNSSVCMKTLQLLTSSHTRKLSESNWNFLLTLLQCKFIFRQNIYWAFLKILADNLHPDYFNVHFQVYLGHLTPLTSTWPHLRCDVGLEEGEYK